MSNPIVGPPMAPTGSLVTWITDMEPEEMAAGMEPVFEDGICALKEHLESR
ncbi:MAG: hypothetical protein JJU45_18270 [Acidimicrobiia bacterium]|nr:hypothetical protein [Acidimicrobiia bacterium]